MAYDPSGITESPKIESGAEYDPLNLLGGKPQVVPPTFLDKVHRYLSESRPPRMLTRRPPREEIGSELAISHEPTQILKPITQKVKDEIKKEIYNMKDKPKTPEDARGLARIKAREWGYDPEKRARE